MPTSLDAIMKQITDAQKKANAANLERYQQLLSVIDTLGKQVGAEGTFGQAEQLLSQVGQAAQTRIGEQATRAQATTEQGLISRGLGSTTIRQSAQRGIRADEERARQEAEERTAGQKAGLLTQRAGLETQIGGMKAGVMERRTDAGPDLGMYASLIQSAGLGGGGLGGGGPRSAVQGMRGSGGMEMPINPLTGQRVTRVTRSLGPMAMAGRSATGQRFQYGGGGGGAGGRVSGGGAFAQAARPQARFFGPGVAGTAKPGRKSSLQFSGF